MEPVLHHASGPPTVPLDIYAQLFDRGKVGDWCWGSEERAGQSIRVLWLIIPAVGGSTSGLLYDRGGELILVFPSHAPNNWAEPGDRNGWDGNEDCPTLHPSIFVRGTEPSPGWHGFFEQGQLRMA